VELTIAPDALTTGWTQEEKRVGQPATTGNGGVSSSSGTGSKARGVVHILEIRCKGCGFCVEFCPRGVLAVAERFNAKGYHPPEVAAPEACTACHLCELLCPDFALGIEELATHTCERPPARSKPAALPKQLPPELPTEVDGAR
jgi:2-oxoglutarate ferredoxin oxidoreductase subunit delta